MAELRKLGTVSSSGEGKLEIEADDEVVAAFMAKHGILYKALRPPIIKLVREAALGNGEP